MKLKGVVRIDAERTHGWQGRVSWSGVSLSKMFSDLKCGGKRNAKEQCAKWVRRTERKLGKPHTQARVRMTTASR